MTLGRRMTAPWQTVGGALICVLVTAGCTTTRETDRIPISKPGFVRVSEPNANSISKIPSANSPALNIAAQSGQDVVMVNSNSQRTAYTAPMPDQHFLNQPGPGMMQAQPADVVTTRDGNRFIIVDGKAIPIQGNPAPVNQGTMVVPQMGTNPQPVQQPYPAPQPIAPVQSQIAPIQPQPQPNLNLLPPLENNNKNLPAQGMKLPGATPANVQQTSANLPDVSSGLDAKPSSHVIYSRDGKPDPLPTIPTSPVDTPMTLITPDVPPSPPFTK